VEKAVLSFPEQGSVRIDCDDCAVRDLQCGDCIMPVLLGSPGVYEVNAGEALALEALADGGLVPHLRLVPLGLPRPASGPASEAV
jgi:hypothetical protein